MLISEEYRGLNAELHARNSTFGTLGHHFAPLVVQLAAGAARPGPATTVLDYGCGKGTLKPSLLGHPLDVREYDPAIPEKAAAPEAADIVVCTDVLEHIEQDCLDAVLDDLRRVTRQLVLLTVCTAPARKTLADGRNAHLIVAPVAWWLPKLIERWELLVVENKSGGFLMVGGAK